MTLLDHKKYFSRFLKQHEGKLHFAAHSHHFWPDVTREAQLEYWDDSAVLSDEKWGKIFGEVIPKTQKHIAEMLHLKNFEQIVIAPNTHELSSRLLSLFVGKSELSILTTSSEFYSWKRQVLRLMELPEVKVTMVPTPDKKVLIKNLKEELEKKPNVFFLSQVFFDSGIAFSETELLDLAKACDYSTLMVVDGYHGFAAIPTDLSKLEGRIFYLGGGYKYAQAGEGVGFMVVPKGDWRPVYTGWYAEHADLAKANEGKVGYSSNGMAFMGATQDPSGLYRFNATWDLFKKEGLTVDSIHNYVQDLQKTFLKLVPKSFLQEHNLVPLHHPELELHGHFLTYESPSELEGQKTQDDLKKLNILIDRRGKRLRFGFGLYQSQTDVEALCQRLKK